MTKYSKLIWSMNVGAFSALFWLLFIIIPTPSTADEYINTAFTHLTMVFLLMTTASYMINLPKLFVLLWKKFEVWGNEEG